MKIYQDLDNINIRKPFITLGTFDGVHLGHQQVFSQLKEMAKENNGESVVITFWPHPRMVLGTPERKISMINTIEEKMGLIEKEGIDHFVILPFTKEFSQLTSQEFIEQFLYEKIGVKGLLVGYDHKFGKGRQGNFDVLNECAGKYGFIIKKIEPFNVGAETVSSTKIREALFAGQIEKANNYLSRQFTLPGHVAKGQEIGRDLGFPTANIVPDSPYKLVPKDGVYAVKVRIDECYHIGMLNIGTRPTVNDDESDRSIEVHIVNYAGDLYDKYLKLYFYKRIRDEMKFNSLGELVEQLNLDKQNITSYFENL